MSLFDTGIRPAVDAWLLTKSKEQRDYGDYWSGSSAGYCMRKIIFERLGVPPVETEADARKQRVFTAGHLFHDWLQAITKSAGLSIAQELEFQDEELMIRGHIDDLVLIEDVCRVCEGKGSIGKGAYAEACWCNNGRDKHLILYDYKTSNSRAFDYKKEEMSRYHKYQLGTYMYMLRKGVQVTLDTNDNIAQLTTGLTEARILIIEKDALRQKEQQLLWSDELEEEIVSWWKLLNKYWKERKIPPCTCADYEKNSRTGIGFMADSRYNPFYYKGKPCSLEYYKEHLTKKETT